MSNNHALWCGLCLFLCVSLKVGATEPVDHPLIESYPNAIISGGSNRAGTNYPIASQAMQSSVLNHVINLEGDLSHLQYEIPETESIDTVYSSYLSSLKSAGFDLVYTCRKKDCGGNLIEALFGSSGRNSNYDRVADDVLNDTNTDFYYLSVKKILGNQNTLYATFAFRQITISSWPVHITQDVFEVKQLEPTKLRVNTNYDKQINLHGKVVLQGLYFDTNKSELKETSRPSLQNISKYLIRHPNTSFYVVGHTDMDGNYNRNIALSLSRANSVCQQLVTQYEIPESQLSAIGVGPVAPLNSNKNNAGKTQNRRVELVLR